MQKVRKIERTALQLTRRKRVAAYARVSSGKDAMLHSLSAQISYYSKFIQRRGDWIFAGIYADEAITGTRDTRPEFQRLLDDCREGSIDLVITKSIPRFARNTVTLLETVRELKELGIDIFFEAENISTLSADGELMITLLASYAQEESRNASENCKWRIKKMFEQGRPNTGRMLGYRLLDGKLYIVPEEAATVRWIYAAYLSGKGKLAIVKQLKADSVPTLNDGTWRESTVMSILQNEKYTGEMLLQKTYSLDHISKKRIMNKGELPMYHVAESHEAIIDKELFAQVQREIKQRSAKYHPSSETPERYLFSGIVHCGVCGEYYRRKIVNAGGKYAKPAWICSTFNNYGKRACSSQQIPEKILIEKTREVLQITELDTNILKRELSEIQVPTHNRLIYVFTDGRTVVVEWQNPSRRESWTQEMKQAAREQQLRRQKNE